MSAGNISPYDHKNPDTMWNDAPVQPAPKPPAKAAALPLPPATQAAASTTQPPRTPSAVSGMHSTKWIALSILITSIVCMIITAYLASDPQLSGALNLCCILFTVAAATLLLGIAIKSAVENKPISPLGRKVGWVSFAALTTFVTALLVISYLPSNPNYAHQIFYPTFAITGSASFLMLTITLIGSVRNRGSVATVRPSQP